VAWNEIFPERVSNRELVSFRFRVVGESIAEAWARAVSTNTDLRIGVGPMVADVKERPRWWNSAWLTQGTFHYEGGEAAELVVTAPIGLRPYAFDDPGATIWVMLDYGWTPAGSFVELAEDPPWTEHLLDPVWRQNSPPVTQPNPLTRDARIIGIQRVWLGENPQELWSSGTYGWGWHLHSFDIEESIDTVHLTGRMGRTDEYEAAVERAKHSGVTMAIPAVAYRWAVRSLLAGALDKRKVLFRTDEPVGGPIVY
jgi:hypothetical protein